MSEISKINLCIHFVVVTSITYTFHCLYLLATRLSPLLSALHYVYVVIICNILSPVPALGRLWYIDQILFSQFVLPITISDTVHYSFHNDCKYDSLFSITETFCLFWWTIQACLHILNGEHNCTIFRSLSPVNGSRLSNVFQWFIFSVWE